MPGENKTLEVYVGKFPVKDEHWYFAVLQTNGYCTLARSEKIEGLIKAIDSKKDVLNFNSLAFGSLQDKNYIPSVHPLTEQELDYVREACKASNFVVLEKQYEIRHGISKIKSEG